MFLHRLDIVNAMLAVRCSCSHQFGSVQGMEGIKRHILYYRFLCMPQYFFFLCYIATLKFLTWNIHDMRDYVKMSAIFSLLKKQCADVVVLVETHAEGPVLRAFKRPGYGLPLIPHHPL